MNPLDFNHDTLHKLFMSQTKGVPAHVIVQAFHRLPFHGVSYTKCTKGMLAESWADARMDDPRRPHGRRSALNVGLGVILSHIREVQKEIDYRKERKAKYDANWLEITAKHNARLEAAKLKRERIEREHPKLVAALKAAHTLLMELHDSPILTTKSGAAFVARPFNELRTLLEEVTAP